MAVVKGQTKRACAEIIQFNCCAFHVNEIRLVLLAIMATTDCQQYGEYGDLDSAFKPGLKISNTFCKILEERFHTFLTVFK